ncbi:MAG: transglycosylase domain-containing protein, partial [Chloroflexota bacterium]
MTSTANLIRRRRARRQRRRQRADRRRTVVMGALLLVFLLVLLPAGAGGALGLRFYAEATTNLPAPQASLAEGAAIGPSQMTDRTGETLIWTIADPLGDDRQWIELDALPPYVAAATLISEDPDYLSSFAPAAPFHAQRLIENYLFGPLPADNTLTGRLVRNTLLDVPENPTAADRANEFALIAELERRHTREEILEWHLNTNTYGNDAYGVDAAAQIYLGKRAADLTVDEAVLLA